MAFKINNNTVINDSNELITGTTYSNLNSTHDIFVGTVLRFHNVAIGCNRIVVGSLDGNGYQGAVYIYDLNKNLINTIYGDTQYSNFANQIAVGSNRIVVGADNLGSGGAFYIYDLDGNLINFISSSTINANLGTSVSVDCGRIVVGAPGDQGFNGAAYIYDLDGNLLNTLNGLSSYGFSGQTVAVGCGRILVGANGANKVYVYNLNGTLIKTITGPVGSELGRDYTISVGCGRIVLGNEYINEYTGSASIYDLNGNLITVLNGETYNNRFGMSVAVDSNRIVIGAPQVDNLGKIYVYDLNGNLLSVLVGEGNLFGYRAIAIGSGKIGTISTMGYPSTQLHLWNLDNTIDVYYDKILENYSY